MVCDDEGCDDVVVVVFGECEGGGSGSSASTDTRGLRERWAGDEGNNRGVEQVEEEEEEEEEAAAALAGVSEGERSGFILGVA